MSDQLPDDTSDLTRILAEAFAGSLRPAELPAGRRDGLRHQVLARAGGGLRTVRAAEAGWMPVSPTSEMRVLRREAGAFQQTVMLRLKPGGEIPAHSHQFEEETFVLEGEIEIGREVLRAGDYQLAEPGSHHDVIRTRTGATLLLRYQTGA